MDQPPLPPAPPMPTGTPSPERRSKSHIARNVAIGVLVLVLASAGSLVAARRKAGAGGADAASPAASPSPVPPATPASFRSQPSAFSIALSWKPGDGGSEPVAYAIDRNGDRVVTVKGSKTQWVDPYLPPGHTYRYSIQAIDAAGRHSEAVTIVTTTKTVPVSQAPIEGMFNVHTTATSHFGYSTFNGYHSVYGWRMMSTCGRPCTLALHDTQEASFHGTLVQHGTSYSGKLRSKGFETCNGTPVYSDVTVNLDVTKAKVKNGRWRAVAIQGTMIVRTAPQLGCIAGGIDETLTGRYYG